MAIPVSRVMSLYRQILRSSREFALPRLRTKLCYNARDMLELYRNEANPMKIQQLLHDGSTYVKWLNAFGSMKTTHLHQITGCHKEHQRTLK